MAQELVLIFDDLGDMYVVDNITEMLTVIDDLELLPIYKSTVYEHKLTMAMEELISKGYVEPSDRPYDTDAGERGIKYLTEEIVKRFGEDNNKKILSEIDLVWEKNKPRLPDGPKKRKKKK